MATDGRTGTLARPRAVARDALAGLLQGPKRRRDATCPTCGTTNDLVVARWCGHCGERLQQTSLGPTRPDRSPQDLARLRRVVGPAFAVLIALLLLVPAALRGNGDVVRGQSARGDAQRSGVVADAAPAAPTEVVWSLDTSAPLVPPGIVHAGDRQATLINGDVLEVLELATGQVVRTQEAATVDADLRSARPFGGMLLLPFGANDNLAGVDLQSGAVRWQGLPLRSAASAALAGALPVGDTVILPDDPSTVLRLDGPTGQVSWEADLPFGINRIAFADEDVVILVTVATAGARLEAGNDIVGSGIAALDARTGALEWAFPMTADEGLAPVAVSGASRAGGPWLARLSLADGPNPLVVVHDIASGQPLRSFPVAGDLLGLALVEDVLVAAATASGTQAFHAGTGEQLWNSDLTPGRLTASADESRFLLRAAPETITVIDLGGTVVAEIGGVHPDGQASLAPGAMLLSMADGMVALRDLTGSQLWQRPLVALGVASMATDGELVAVNGQGGTVVLDGRTGEQVTSVERTSNARGAGIAGSVAVSDGVVVASPVGIDTSGRALAAIAADTGIALWNEDGSSPPVVGPITREGGLAWIPVADEIHAYEFATGRRAFAELSGVPRGPLVVTDELVIATPADPSCAVEGRCQQSVIAIARERQSPGPRDLAWTSDVATCGAAAVRDGRVLVPTLLGPGALDLTTGELAWLANSDAGCGALAVGSQQVVQVTGTTVRAWNLADGMEAWSVGLGQTATTSPVLAGDEVVVGTTTGDLIALRVDSGEVAWQYRLPAPALTDPVVVGERWVVLLRDGRVVGLR